MGRLEGKTVIVTGGALGIGCATAMRLAREDAAVVVTDILDDDGKAVADQIGREGGTAMFKHLDVADEEEVRGVFDEARKTYGSVDVLVNNAGIAGVDKPTDQYTREEWDRVMSINVDGVFLCTKHAIGHMREAGGGSIVNLSSIYGIISAPDIPAYHASKGAVRLMTKTDALTYAKEGIRVNSVHPGFIWTPLVEDLARQGDQDPDEFRSQLDSLHPIGHVGEPEDIANGVLFLACDESKFITGAELVIDGGYTAQ